MMYLASPYSHPRPEVREARYRSVCRATAMLLEAGQAVFAPVVHSHPLVAFGLPAGWDFWQRFDRDHLVRCDELVVLTLDGWRESVGVAAEIAWAEELGKPVRYVDPATFVTTTRALAPSSPTWAPSCPTAAPSCPTAARVAKEVAS